MSQVSDNERFQLDLELVQCLANSEYISWLAQTKRFEDPAFLKYLEYLQYFQRPEYSQFITYALLATLLNHVVDVLL